VVSLTIDLPDEALSALRIDSNEFAKELRFAAAVQWYHQGLLSGSTAGEIAGMTRLEFLDELARRRLDTVKIDFDDLAAELRRG
jgi:predicted HTH domain antitoxin